MQAVNKTDSGKIINMVFVVGSINGILKVYQNETNYLNHGVATKEGGVMFDDDDEESPRTKRR